MSKYTTELRWVCESKSGFDEDVLKNKTVDEIITASRASIFNFNYPIYAEAHRDELEHKILKHYYTREIGAETFGLWQLQLNDKLNLIMPYYNKLYQYQAQIAQKGLDNIDVNSSQLRTDNLLKTDAYTHGENTEIDKENEIHDTITFTDTTDDKYSDTPQGNLSGVITDSYLTDFRRISKSDTTGQVRTETGNDTVASQKTDAGTTANTGTQNYQNTEHGYRGSDIYEKMLSQLAEVIINIDRMIINELSDLFFNLW